MQFLRTRSIFFYASLAMLLPASYGQVSAKPGPEARTSALSSKDLREADAAFRAGSAAYLHHDLRTAHEEFARLVELAPHVAAGHTAFGTVLLAEGDGRGALTQLELAHKLDPNDMNAMLNLAMAYSQLREYAKSAAMFQLLDQSTTAMLSPEAELDYINALAATARLEAAQTEAEHALTNWPDSATLHDALGTLLAQRGIYDRAKPEFQRAIALDPALASAHYHLGSVFLHQNDFVSAVSELTQANSLVKDNVDYILQLGHALRANGQDQEAIDVLQHEIQIDPASINAKYELALTLQAAGRAHEALPYFQQVETAHPEDPSALTNLALAMVQTGDARSAIPFYLRALKIDAEDATLREDLGVAYLQQSDLDHAIEQFRSGLAIDSKDANLHYDLGLALKLKDKPEAAITELASAEGLAPQLPDPPYTLGVLNMQLGRFTESQRELEKATTLRPDNGDAWALLGNVYKQTDQPQKAITALQRAIQLLPAQPSPHITLASILSEQGDRAGAAAERKKAADLSRVAISRQRANFALDSGRALLSRGQITAAIVQLQTSVDADPTFADAHLALANALAQQGRSADAALERQKAQKLAIPSANSSSTIDHP